MDRKVLWLCITAGSTAGGFLPSLFGQSSFGLLSVIGTVVGAIAGIWAAGRITA